jgi:PAS domain S-box-containing protein
MSSQASETKLNGLEHHGSIRTKLMRIIALTCCAALLAAFAIFGLYDLQIARRSQLDTLRTLTRLMGSNSAAALAFGDDEAAEKILRSLEADPRVLHAALYTPDGRVLATYNADPLVKSYLPPRPEADSIAIAGKRIRSFSSVSLSGNVIGTVYLESTTVHLEERERGLAIIGVVAVLISLAVALILGSKLQGGISNPILDLARTAFTVSIEKNYSVRASFAGSDEIAFLYEQFNQMLDGIQTRDKELREARADLEKRVNERTAYLNALIETSPLGIVTSDSAGRVRVCNAAFEKLFGYTKDELIGAELNSLILPPQFKREADEFKERREGGGFVQAITQRRRKDGTLVPVELYAISLRVAGETVGNLLLYNDVTERKRAEDSLKAAKEAAEGANRAKSEFLANMSHEIRTPMNGIIGMTQLALESDLNPEVREYLELVNSSADALLFLLNEILDFSKIESGKMELESEPFALRESLGQTLKTLAHAASRKRLEFAWTPAPDVPEWLIGDCGRLRQVLVNLAGNAIKFTELGKVEVSATLQNCTREFAELRFDVRDTGIGIAADKLKLIFDVFTQADASTTRKYGGTGLGLAISQRLVAQMGGALQVESKLGEGSNFYFIVRLLLPPMNFVPPKQNSALLNEAPPPIANVAIEPRPRESAPSATGNSHRKLRVLLAEDNDVNCRLATKLLEKEGHSIVAAMNGREALEAIEREKFDLVLMDGQMPEMDGLEAIRRIRAQEKKSGAHLPIISVTARAMRGDREACLTAGADAYVSKPLRASELFDAIERCCPNAAGAQHAQTPASTVDEDKLLERCQGDRDLLVEIIGLFEGETDGLLRQVVEAIESRDASTIAKTAHTLKGSIGNFTDAEPYKAAKRLEQDALQNNFSAAEADFARLSTEVRRLRNELQRLAHASQELPVSAEKD